MYKMRVTYKSGRDTIEQYTMTLYSDAVCNECYLLEYMDDFDEVILVDIFDDHRVLIIGAFRDSTGGVHIT